MSQLLSRLTKHCLGKPTLLRSSLLLRSNGFSSSLLQTTPCSIIGLSRCGEDLGKLIIRKATQGGITYLEKNVPLDLMKEMGTIGSSHGWVATWKEDGIVCLQDDLNPVASDTYPKRISLPPLVTLPHCQTQIVTNVAMSTSSPEDEECVVAIKFLGPQLSFCRPAQRNSEWINISITNTCFFSSRVMYSKKDDMFLIPGSGGHLIGSWDLRTDNDNHNPKIQRLRFKNLPKLTKTKCELLDSCCRSEHLVDSTTTGETFLVKWYKKTTISGMMKTRALIVFKLDGQGNAVYTNDIGDLCIFLSKSEPFCVPVSSLPGSIARLLGNCVKILDVDEMGLVYLHDSSMISGSCEFPAPYHIPPQNID